MNCCRHCDGLEREFDRGTADADLRRFRRRGPLAGTRILLGALERLGIGGATLLDIGGGVGAVHHVLLGRGAERATHVDASSAYLAAAREEAERQDHSGRVDFVHGDFVELAPRIAPADVVTLDRVVCCYPDMPSLVALSAARARRLYGLVFPRDAAWVRPVFPLANAWFRLRRCPFRIFRHPAAAVDEVVRHQGLSLAFEATTSIWQVRVYAR